MLTHCLIKHIIIMASRRKLKKNVNGIIDELVTECIIQELINPQIDKQKLNEIFEQLFNIKIEYVNRISHTEPGNAKKYYRNFREKFSGEVSDVIAKLSNLS